MNFIYMKPKKDGSVYYAVEEVLYEGAHGFGVFIPCTSELENGCNNCTLFNDCNRLMEQGKRLLKKAGLCNSH